MKNKRVAIMIGLLVVLIAINAVVIWSFSSGPKSMEEELAEEPILSFQSEFRFNADDTIFVSEQVKAKSVGKNFKRGITRKLPIVFTTETGGTQSATYELVSVMRNGETIGIAEPQNDGRFITFYLGEADKYLTPGIYDFLFQYTASSKIETSPEFKKVRLDVTGSPLVPVQSASAIIRLPEPFEEKSVVIKGFLVTPNKEADDSTEVGVQHSFALDDGRSDPAATGKPLIKIWTTRALKPLERLEISLSWPNTSPVVVDDGSSEARPVDDGTTVGIPVETPIVGIPVEPGAAVPAPAAPQ